MVMVLFSIGTLPRLFQLSKFQLVFFSHFHLKAFQLMLSYIVSFHNIFSRISIFGTLLIFEWWLLFKYKLNIPTNKLSLAALLWEKADIFPLISLFLKSRCQIF